MAKFVDSALSRLAGLEPFPQPRVIRVRHPIVLMHGFGLLAGLRRGGHLHDEALHLRLHGVMAYAPNVAPYSTVSVRAEMWRDRIRQVLDETGAEKVNLVAHSMGGLDARYMISVLGLHEVVASLVTVASPHHGSSLACVVLEQPERVRTWVTDLANWMGTAALDEVTADFLSAVQELTPEYVHGTFNARVTDHPSVRYWSYAGRAGKGTNVPINPFLRLFNHRLYQRDGVNDGLVSEESAHWGTFLGSIDADHTQQVGLEFTPRSTFNSNDFYRSIASFLSEQDL